VLSETGVPGDWLKWEVDDAHQAFCREQVTILGGAGVDRVLTSGVVMGKITASGKWAQFNNTAVNGLEDAAGVLLYPITALNLVDNPNGIVVVRGPCAVAKQTLQWPDTASTAERNAAMAQLETLGIEMREAA
jgi:hypothetical protein